MRTLTEEDVREAFANSSMQPEFFYDSYYEVESTSGIWFLPCSHVGVRGKSVPARELRQWVTGSLIDADELVPRKNGWLARMSMPGFLDCTDWTVHDSELAAAQYLVDTYAD